ncbi:MAG: VOC family protein [Acidimicrobiia bacterium]|nr:VOC family protein [Acidimicrobiia bacterium]
MTVRWLTAFVDVPASDVVATTTFWARATGWTASAPEGGRGEYVTLVPDHGDAFLRIQRIDDGPAGCHLDAYVDDVDGTIRHAVELGAVVERPLDDGFVLRSPAGSAFCVFGHDGQAIRPSATGIGDGPLTLLDQLCLDIPPAGYETECSFWSALLGWERRAAMLPEFSYLERPAGIPLRLLFQRLDDTASDRQPAAHLDIAAGEDLDGGAAVHEQLGARILERHPFWIVMTDPAGLPYCLIRRPPNTGPVTSR